MAKGRHEKERDDLETAHTRRWLPFLCKWGWHRWFASEEFKLRGWDAVLWRCSHCPTWKARPK